ncbi:[FeFe] hydrogenase H-cluster radical SAM maturase HydE, partial [Oscillospiraceae bacterium OttesenSCG-928-G22]|nr:[FeFe] hydrogenase H-cluster radical SAM maturase HydE [Oscillospiraceae bacterium OttesenSCG-928-G22]
MTKLLKKLAAGERLSEKELLILLERRDDALAAELCEKARAACDRVYGRRVFLRGLLEISNHCRNDCLYCGIRRSNVRAERYRLRPEAIADCCAAGYESGLRTFVLQGGEDGAFTDDLLCSLVAGVKRRFPDCAVTLSLGERSAKSYRRLFDAGADRYLLRHETANPEHYARLHPPEMSYGRRMECLFELR